MNCVVHKGIPFFWLSQKFTTFSNQLKAYAVVTVVPALLHNVLISSLLLLMKYYFAHKSVDFIPGHDSQQKGVDRAIGLDKPTQVCV